MAHGDQTQDKMSEVAFDFICTSCDRENKTFEAVKYCMECAGYCCQSCTDMHIRFPALKVHNFLDVSQGSQSGKQQARVPEFPTERCNIHIGKVVDLYCKRHDSVGCVTCMATDHKSCAGRQIYSIPDMLHTLCNLSDSEQTQDRLKQMMVSLTTLDKSKEVLLRTLETAKKEAIQQIEIFQNALHAILRKAAESSKQEVEEAYNNLEEEIRQDKLCLTKTNDVVQDAGEKLDKTVANRAQRFVRTIIAKKTIKAAEQIKQKMDDKKDGILMFKPNKSLIKSIKSLQGVGNVQIIKKKKHDLYKLRGSKDINMKVTDDSKDCDCCDSCITYDNRLIVTDDKNSKLKHVDIHLLTVVEDCPLDSSPAGICSVNQNEIAVACFSPNKIQFVSIEDQMIPTRHIDMNHKCMGIATKDDKLYVTDESSSLYVYDMAGTMLKTISTDNTGNKVLTNSKHITINESGNKMFVADWNNGLVCFDGEGSYLTTIKDNALRNVYGACVDNRGNIFVTSVNSHNVIQYTEDGNKIGVVVQQKDGINGPISVCYHQGLNRLFIIKFKSNVLKMYELE
ncbi:hypothetical protein ACF0H5_010755 [Mactra antiquata]